MTSSKMPGAFWNAPHGVNHLELAAVGVIGPTRLWANPDCGLKTRGYAETEAALRNLVAAARQVRAGLAG